eukprot:1554868-Pleurochrysis_carterae.AAC.1
MGHCVPVACLDLAQRARCAHAGAKRHTCATAGRQQRCSLTRATAAFRRYPLATPSQLPWRAAEAVLCEACSLIRRARFYA